MKLIFFSLCFSLVFITNSNAQVFIDDGSSGTLSVVKTNSGDLTTPATTDANVALYIDGNLTIEGGYSNDAAEVQITGDLSFTGTNFTTTGDEVLKGTGTQTLTGSFTGANSFNNLILKKTASTLVSLSNPIELSSTGVLNFQGGIVSTGANSIKIQNSSANSILNAGANGSMDNYIEGQLLRNVVAGSSYLLPTGASHTNTGGGDGVQYATLSPTAGSGYISAKLTKGSGTGISNTISICPSGSTGTPKCKLQNQ